MFLDAFREMGEVVSVRFCRDMALGDRINLSISPVSKMVRVLLIMISDLLINYKFFANMNLNLVSGLNGIRD